MPPASLLQQLVDAAYTLEIARHPDTPLNPGDRRLLVDSVTGRVLIARAPLRMDVSAPQQAS